jgi:hypothetical protein
MTTRTVAGTILKPDGTAWAGGVVQATLGRRIVSGGDTVVPTQVQATADNLGAFTMTLAVPSDGTGAAYRLTLPDLSTLYFTLDQGGAVDLADLVTTDAAAPFGGLDTLDALVSAEAGIRSSADSTLTSMVLGKAALVHSHVITDTTGLQAALDAKAALTHSHAQADVTGLTAALAAKAALVPGGRPKLAAQIYPTIPGVEPSNIGTASLSAGQIRYEPFPVEVPTTMDQLSVEVTVVGANVRMGLYTADANLQPLARIADTGAIDVSTLGVKGGAIGPVTLVPGIYLKAINADASVSLRAARGGSRLTGYNPGLGANLYVTSLVVSAAFGAFSDPGVAWTSSGSGTSPFIHAVFCRVTGYP